MWLTFDLRPFQWPLKHLVHYNQSMGILLPHILILNAGSLSSEHFLLWACLIWKLSEATVWRNRGQFLQLNYIANSKHLYPCVFFSLSIYDHNSCTLPKFWWCNKVYLGESIPLANFIDHSGDSLGEFCVDYLVDSQFCQGQSLNSWEVYSLLESQFWQEAYWDDDILFDELFRLRVFYRDDASHCE